MGTTAVSGSKRNRIQLLLDVFEEEIRALPVSIAEAKLLSDDDRATMSLEWYDLLVGGLPELQEAILGYSELRRYQRMMTKLIEVVPILRAAGVPITSDVLHALTPATGGEVVQGQ